MAGCLSALAATLAANAKAESGDFALVCGISTASPSMALRTFAYNTAISACVKCKQPAETLEFLEVTQWRGKAPSMASYNAGINAYEKDKQPTRQWSSLESGSNRHDSQHDSLQCSNQRRREG